MRVWLTAARPRTLPLALASIVLGSLLAAADGAFSWPVALLATLTTVLLQVLSNLANDYGDFVHGADSLTREGPRRAVQSGHIPARTMRRAVGLFALLSLLAGLALLGASPVSGRWLTFGLFVGLGLLAIAAAITYTAGKRPYGYAGLGDVSVLVFFGWVGVLGVYFLHTSTWRPALLLPATACGLLATAVLNVNNIRDLTSDRAAGKRSLPVRLGPRRARIYHLALLTGALLAALGYVVLVPGTAFRYLFLLTLPLLAYNGYAVWRYERPAELDPYLRQMALSTLVFVLTFGVGQLLG